MGQIDTRLARWKTERLCGCGTWMVGDGGVAFSTETLTSGATTVRGAEVRGAAVAYKVLFLCSDVLQADVLASVGRGVG